MGCSLNSATIVSGLPFPGQIYDQETALNYNLNRYYDSYSGRYTQSDPIGPTRNYSDPVVRALLKAGMPLLKSVRSGSGLNQPFAYVENNPVKYIDPFGFANGDIIPPGSLNHWNTGDASVYPSNYAFPPPPKITGCELVCSGLVGKGCFKPAAECAQGRGVPGLYLGAAVYGACEITVEVGCRFICDKVE